MRARQLLELGAVEGALPGSGAVDETQRVRRPARDGPMNHGTDRRDPGPVGDEDRLRLRRAVEDEGAPRPGEGDVRPDRQVEQGGRAGPDPVEADLEGGI